MASWSASGDLGALRACAGRKWSGGPSCTVAVGQALFTFLTFNKFSNSTITFQMSSNIKIQDTIKEFKPFWKNIINSLKI
jgi:hypothetical protein